MTKPITPDQIDELTKPQIPNCVVEAVNKLIVANWNKSLHSAIVRFDEVLEALETNAFTKKISFDRDRAISDGWMDFEDLYREQGWVVTYNAPHYTEEWKAYYAFGKAAK